uniref:Heat shock cognate 70 kDa protein 1 n=2 Tax=Cajanus cajan TaxID=3821 RepID=A0A151TD29_CAJCA|nr:Heat shock cognate 70 kDa protein 1 [Cajanus cajan]
MIQEAEIYKAEDNKFLKKAKTRNDLDYCVYKIRNVLKKEDINSMLCSQEKEDISSAINKATDLLDENYEQDDISMFEDCLKDLEIFFGRLKAMG